MDRPDERKHSHNEHETPERQGDVLGLGGTAVPKAPGDPTAAHDPEAVARQRARARAGEAEDTTKPAVDTDSKGATGIDMGAGGQGTDISGK